MGRNRTTMAKWQEVRGWILSQIQEHGWPEGAPLPSDRAVALACGCSLQPVLRAMQALVTEGIIQRQAGAATQIRSLPPVREPHRFSFGANAQCQGAVCRTRVLEQCRRLPNPGELHAMERRAQSHLGLSHTEPFYVIARLRLLNDAPRVIERAYLNPIHFPRTFLEEHDFATDSLLQSYITCGFDPNLRDTQLQARMPREDEQRLLDLREMPVQEIEQVMYASRTDTPTPVVIEYLSAIYHNWTFRMVDRRSTSGVTNNESES